MGVLRDLQKGKRKPSRGWALFKTDSGRIPTDLLEVFVEILKKVDPEELPNKPPMPVLNPSETDQLRRVLNFLSRYGLEGVAQDSYEDDQNQESKPPVFEKLKGKPYKDIIEVKFANTEHNLRLLGSKCPPKLVFLYAFKKKSNSISESDKKTAKNRLKTLNQRGDCT